MLKFSGFADLTSCLKSDRRGTTAEGRLRATTTWRRAEACMHDSSPKTARGISMPSMRQGLRTSPSTLTHNDTEAAHSKHLGR